jgi:hypothetical protein
MTEISTMSVSDIKVLDPITVIQILVVVIILSIVLYAILQTTRQGSNCSTINAYKGPSPAIQNINSTLSDKTVLDVYVKTAYNCCCSGNFKNDYVDNCALLNCAKQRVRALHFDIYSLNNRPVISTSSVVGNKYKELYNSLDMYSTMSIINTKFMIISDPLFLIFNVNSNISTTYESMYTILLEIFGTGNPKGNRIYYTNEIGGTKLSSLINKVVICVQAYDPKVFYASSLSLITSLDLNGSTSKIYTETNILDYYTQSTTAVIIPRYPQVLFPNKQTSATNFDFVTTGIKYGITFIGMNFQKKDYLLDIYNTGFGNYSFKEKLLVLSDSTTDIFGNYSITNFSTP